LSIARAIASMTPHFRPNVEKRLRVAYGTSERSLTIEAPDGPVLRVLRSLFPDSQLPAAQADASPADLVVRPLGNGWEVRSRFDEPAERFTGDAPLVSGLELGIVGFLLSLERTRTHLHAAGAVRPGASPGAALLALGPSGSGKSTLALAWSRLGLPLLGDDTILVGEEGLLSPFRRPVKIVRERLEESGLLPFDRLLSDPVTGEVRYDPAGGPGWAAPGARARLVARVRWQAGSALVVAPLARADALATLMASIQDTGAGPAPSLGHFAELLRDAERVDVTFGRAADAAGELVERLG
jgi:hypothetical protein